MYPSQSRLNVTLLECKIACYTSAQCQGFFYDNLQQSCFLKRVGFRPSAVHLVLHCTHAAWYYGDALGMRSGHAQNKVNPSTGLSCRRASAPRTAAVAGPTTATCEGELYQPDSYSAPTPFTTCVPVALATTGKVLTTVPARRKCGNSHPSLSGLQGVPLLVGGGGAGSRRADAAAPWYGTILLLSDDAHAHALVRFAYCSIAMNNEASTR